MKRILIVASALALAVGCAPENGLSLGNAHALDDSCVQSGNKVLRSSGRFNVARTLSYVASFDVASVLEARTLQVGSDVLVGSNRNDAILNQLVLNYASTPSLGLKQEILPLLLRIPASSADNFLTTDIIGPLAAESLRARLTTNGDQAEVLVRIQLKGALAGGGAIATNEILFPVQAYFQIPNCPGTVSISKAGACGNDGQDESVLTCSTTP